MHRRFVFSSSVLALALAACSTTASDNIKTKGLYAAYTVEQDSDTAVTARAKLTVGGSTGTIVELSEGEGVYVNNAHLNNKTKLSGIDINYSASIPAADKYAFEFRRSDGEIVKHEVAAAATFQITSAALTGTYASSYTVTWAPSGSGANVDISVDSDTSGCGLSTLASNVNDNGTYTFTGDKVQPTTSMMQAPPTCVFTVTIEKKVTANLGAPFQGGTASSVAKRTTSLTVRPM